MILITEATEKFGNAIIDSIIHKGIPLARIASLVRSKKEGMDLLSKGITLRIAEQNIYASLVEAFNCIDKLLLIPGKNLLKNEEQYLYLINAAKEAGVKHILYTSFECCNESGSSRVEFLAQSQFYAEKIIKESGISYTIFHYNIYIDMLPLLIRNKVIESDVYFPAEEGNAGFVLLSEMTQAVANVLAGDGHENKEYYISNSENLSSRDIVCMISDLCGNATIYNSSILKLLMPKKK